MAELLALLVALGILGAFLYTVWWICRGVFRWFGQVFGAGATERMRTCAWCREPIPDWGDCCPHCGYEAGEPVTGILRRELNVTARHLRRLHEAGKLPDEQYDPIREVVEAEIEAASSAGLADVVHAPTEHAEPSSFDDISTPSTFDLQAAAPSVPESPPPPPSSEPLAPPPAGAPGTTVAPADSDPVPAANPRGGLLRGFMEEKNIRAGEVLAGMLIVGSAIGLVVSLWATLKDQIPYLPALLFMTITAGIHGVGVFSLKRWKLESTSRGLLTIAVLLAPLNFLALIALSGQRLETMPLFLGGSVLLLCAFGAMIHQSSGVLLPGWRWQTLVAVAGSSATQLAISRRVDPTVTTPFLVLLGSLPLGCLLAPGLSILRSAERDPDRLAGQAKSLLMLLGFAVFSFVLAAGLLVAEFGSVGPALERLAPLVAIAALPCLGLGLLLHGRLAESTHSTLRLVGTSVAILGAFVQLAALLLAWPNPALLAMVGVVDFVCLSWLGFRHDMPILHPAALAALALVGEIAFFRFAGDLPVEGSQRGRVLAELLLTGRSSLLLMGFTVVSGLGALGLKRLERHSDVWGYALAGALLGAGSVAIAFWAGFFTGQDGDWTTPVFAVASIAALCANRRFALRRLTWVGSGLLLAAWIHALEFNEVLSDWLTRVGLASDDPIQTALLAHATVAALLAWFLDHRQGDPDAEQSETAHGIREAFLGPLTISALLTSAPAAWMIFPIGADAFGHAAMQAFWVSAVWFAFAWVNRSARLFGLGQFAFTAGLILATTSLCGHASWWQGTPITFWDPRYLQAVGIVLALASLGGTVARSSVGDGRFRRLVGVNELTVDRVVLGSVIGGFVGVTVAGCTPGIIAELALSRPETFGLGPVFAVSLLLASGLHVAWSISGERPYGSIDHWFFATLLLAAAVVVCAVPIAETWQVLGIPHAPAFGVGAWLLLLALGIALAATLWERFKVQTMAELLFLSIAAPLLIGGLFEEIGLTATALRWSLAAYGLLLAAALWSRTRLEPVVDRMHLSSWPRDPSDLTERVRLLGLSLTGLPVLALTALTLDGVAMGRIAAAAESSGWMLAVSLAGPLVVLGITLTGHAVRERRPVFACGGGALFNAAVSAAYLAQLWERGESFDLRHSVVFAQWNALAFGSHALLWLGLRRWIEPEAPDESTPRVWTWTPHSLLGFQCALAVRANAALLAGGTLAIVLVPRVHSQSVGELGSVLGMVSVLVSIAATVAYCLPRSREPFGRLAGVFGLMLVAVAACAVVPWNSRENWLAFHVLTVGVVGLCCVADLTGWWLVLRENVPGAGFAKLTQAVSIDSVGPDAGGEADSGALNRLPLSTRYRADASTWLVALAVGAALLAVRGGWNDPSRPWYSAGAMVIVAGAVADRALRERSQRAGYASVLLLMLSTSLVAIGPWIGLWERSPEQAWIELIQWNLIALAVGGGLWLAVEIWWQRRGTTGYLRDLDGPAGRRTSPELAVITLVQTAADVAVIALFSLVGYCTLWRSLGAEGIALPFASTTGVFPVASTALGWTSLLAVGALLIGCLWDRAGQHALHRIYAVGLSAVMLGLDARALAPRELGLGVAIALSGYVLLTGLLWSLRRPLGTRGRQLGIANEASADVEEWLPKADIGLATVVSLLSLWIVLTFEEAPQRYYGSIAVLALAPGLTMLATGRWKPILRSLALVAGALAAVDFGWALIAPETDAVWLLRSTQMLVSAGTVAFLYAMPIAWLVARAEDWLIPVRQVATWTCGLAIAALLWTLALEAIWFVPDVGVPIGTMRIALVSAALVGLIAGLLSIALLPGRDPWDLAERGRMLYVVAAEIVGALLFLHVYLAQPELFHGYLRPYWPFIVMAIAFVGVGIGELAERRGLRVLSEPMRQTGAFLPLLPVLGFWTLVSNTSYSSVLFVVGLLYAVLSVSRRSFGFGLLAALTGNGGLWSLLDEKGQSLLDHPQFWLIPPALSVLIAAQLNRSRISGAQLAAIRYVCVMAIYLSSTAEMFITGVGASLIPPMALAVLSVTGALVGILLHVRSFLFLGSGFLLLSIVTIVWHSARNIGHVWPWFVFFLALGLAILALFGFFEKKRNDVLRLVDAVRQWDA